MTAGESQRRGSVSAGLLLFRRSTTGTEVFLAHPGGPFWRHRDAGGWSIPKGGVNPGEQLLVAAQREFHEETGIQALGPFLPLGSIRQKGGKIVHAWAWEGDADPAQIVSNSVEMEWPRGSGRTITVPEVDRCGWFPLPIARGKMIAAQAELLDRLQIVINGGTAGSP
ncbi:MAG TPA: NUDIX domain-containing protein [Gemmatimonadaceae bacterium]|nr:NUDIX domain-containing protein [Gemmatimonadaceae bacterium]